MQGHVDGEEETIEEECAERSSHHPKNIILPAERRNDHLDYYFSFCDVRVTRQNKHVHITVHNVFSGIVFQRLLEVKNFKISNLPKISKGSWREGFATFHQFPAILKLFKAILCSYNPYLPNLMLK